MLYGVVMFCVMFIVVFFVYYMIFDDMLKKEKYARISELVLLTNKYKLKKDRKQYKSILTGIALINSFIIALTIALVVAIKLPMVIKLIVAFFLMLILIFVLYHFYGKYLSKKWGEK